MIMVFNRHWLNTFIKCHSNYYYFHINIFPLLMMFFSKSCDINKSQKMIPLSKCNLHFTWICAKSRPFRENNIQLNKLRCEQQTSNLLYNSTVKHKIENKPQTFTATTNIKDILLRYWTLRRRVNWVPVVGMITNKIC